MTISEQEEFAELGAFLGYVYLPCMAMYDREAPRGRFFIGNLLILGSPEDEIKTMLKHNPERLLNIV